MIDSAAISCSFFSSVAEVPQDMWNALSGPQPFLRHEFLLALEESGSVGAGTGWRPEPLVVREGTKLAALVPLYRKSHSYGEYVFDWAWARAYQDAGLSYYPKLVATIPFTPITGPRLLCGETARQAALTQAAARALRTHAARTGASSVHWLFTTTDDSEHLAQEGFSRRTGFQFHWQNGGWSDFTDYLAALSAPKRKNIRRERRQVASAGVQYTFHEGADLNEALWDAFYDLYLATIAKYGAIPYLTRAFFSRIGATVPGVILLLGTLDTKIVAGALFFRDATTLYGRYWGALAALPGLHFETCYYQAIDYCLAHGLDRFEAGAQGEHKLSRGFLPTPTYSMHWLDHPQFHRAVDDYLARENAGLEITLNELNAHTPFRKPS
ncbi:MAG: GNAT family N-acetyltransferase [Acidiferrobacter sp.]